MGEPSSDPSLITRGAAVSVRPSKVSHRNGRHSSVVNVRLYTYLYTPRDGNGAQIPRSVCSLCRGGWGTAVNVRWARTSLPKSATNTAMQHARSEMTDWGRDRSINFQALLSHLTAAISETQLPKPRGPPARPHARPNAVCRDLLGLTYCGYSTTGMFRPPHALTTG